MNLHHWHLGAGTLLTLRDEAEWRERSLDRPVVVTAEGRATLAWNSWMPASIWCAARGRIRIAGRDLVSGGGADDVLVAEQGTRLTVQPAGPNEATLVGLLLPAQIIQEAAERELGRALDEPLLFPAWVRHDAALSLRLLNLAHAALRRPGAEPSPDRIVLELVEHLVRLQSGYDAAIERCPGRSTRYRRQLFLRLLRARNYIEATVAVNTPLGRLADVAKLSPTHFLRLYRHVFGQTPHRHVIETRLAAARELLLGSSQGVSDICRSLGFENRCAFARVFKQHYGIAPSEVRRHAGPDRQRAANERRIDVRGRIAANGVR